MSKRAQPRLSRRRFVLLTATGLLAACQAAPTPTPAKPTEAPKPAATQPAAATPVAKPAASPAASPSPAAAAQAPAVKPAAKLADFKMAVSGEGEFKDGLQKATNFNKIPAGLATESMVKDGVKIEPSYLNESEAPMQALVQGSVQMAQTAFASAMAAIEKGAPVKIVAETRRPEYVMVALKEMKTPKDFDGKRVAIHSNISSVALMTRLYLKAAPEAKPNIIVIPGSPNRIQAMLSGQIDASVVQLGDDDAILAQQPDKWAVVFNYAKEMPDLLDSILVVRDDFLAQNRPTVLEFTKRLLEAHRKVNSDVNFLIQAAKEREVTIPKGATLENHARRYVEAEVWPNNGGLSQKAYTFSTSALVETGFIKSEVPANQAVDLSVLDDVLKQIGPA